jgi:hypothetical protein
MEYVVALLIGVVIGVAGMVSAMRRAASKPNGTTAKVVTIMGGGGPKPDK